MGFKAINVKVLEIVSIIRKYITTINIFVEDFRKYDDPTTLKEMVMAKEQSRKIHLNHKVSEERKEVSVINLLH